MELDHCITRVKMGDAFFFTTQTEPNEINAPPDVIIESEIAEWGWNRL